jgi:prefoldin subunit 1
MTEPNSSQILIQIQQTAVQSQKALNVSLQQTSVKDRERRILQLTIDEISKMKGDVNLYKGVGKMYVAGFEIGAS